MTFPLQYTLLIGAAYLIGAIPFGFLIGMAKGVDIRTKGSKNIGATNAGRLLGRKWGVLAFILDVAKGFGPTVVAGTIILAAHRASLRPGAFYLLWLHVGIAAVIGHNYPVYLKFRGGKGVATSLGVVLGIYPFFTFAGLLSFVVWCLCVALTRYVSLGSLAGALSMPLFYIAIALHKNWHPFSEQLALTAFAALMALLIVYRHRENIKRLRQGTENKIGKKT